LVDFYNPDAVGTERGDPIQSFLRQWADYQQPHPIPLSWQKDSSPDLQKVFSL
jgi:hypothetical protein